MDYVWAIVYILIGLVSALCHWAKKRYIDHTICCDLISYIKHDPKTTYQAVSAVIMAEIGLSLAHTGGGLSLEQFVAALGAGYISDSTLNRAPKNE